MKSFRDLHLGEEAAGGLAAGVVGTVIGFPLDTIKTRMQTGAACASRGIAAAGTQVVREEGFLALYRGIAPPMLSLSILNTIIFPTYMFFRETYGGSHGFDIRNGLAGASVGPICGIVSTVENLVKTQMQTDRKGRYRSSWHCVTTLVQRRGIGVVYTGHAVNTAREFAFLSSYFFLYEGLRYGLLDASGGSKLAVPVAGGLAGATSWAASFPLDCVRAGVQGSDVYDGKRQRGAAAVFRNLMDTRGIRGLYSGVSPTIARAFLVSGSRFSAYECALWLIRGGRDAREHEHDI